METKKPQRLLSAGGSLDWHTEFRLPARFPRGTPIEEIKECMRSIGEPEIFLRELDEHIEIVIKLPKPSDILPKEAWKVLKKDGVTLPRVFDALLWKKLDADRSVIWKEFADTARESYRQLWLEFFKKGYVGHSHPLFEQGLEPIVREMDSEGKFKRRRGPSTLPQAEIASIRNRYDELVRLCASFHRSVVSAVSSPNVMKRGKSPKPSEIRRAVFASTKSLQGLPLFTRIFGGEAFQEYWCGLRHARLHDPKSWKPHKLAISLLAFERSQKWETLEKKLRRQKATAPSSTKPSI